jgi:ankyrin repeat protein
MFAANDGHVAVVQALLEAGADIRIKNKVSDSADTSESTRTYD